jgi:hypothetical protein
MIKDVKSFGRYENSKLLLLLLGLFSRRRNWGILKLVARMIDRDLRNLLHIDLL